MSDSPDILKVKSDWQLEVQLDRGTLVLSANSIFDQDVNLMKHEGVRYYRASQSTFLCTESLEMDFWEKLISCLDCGLKILDTRFSVSTSG